MTKRIDYAGVVLSMDPEREERQQVRTQLQWDYGQVPALHRKTVEDAAVEIAVSGRQMTASVMGIGGALLRAKGALQHGQFEEWCRVEFGMSERTAQNMMNVARTFAGKSAKISLLSDSTLYLLAAPSTPEPVREAVIAQAEATGRSPSVAEVRKSIRLFVENLRGIVRLWAEEHWLRSGREIPPNPSHTNGQFWQELTAWLHGNVTDTWTEADLKAAINQEYRYYRDEVRAAPSGTSAAQPAGLALISGAVLEERVKQEIMQHYMRPMNPGEALWAANDMRRAAQTKEGKFWRRVCVMPTTVDEIADCVLRLADEVTIGFDRWLPKPAGQPLMQVLATDEERQIEAGIAVMDEAERQALAASDWQVMQTAPAAPTERVVSEREAELQRWWVRLIGMQSDLHNWADLTGRHVATGECERGLRKMLEITERELAILRGEVVEESEGWG